jgi:hypothetical protein
VPVDRRAVNGGGASSCRGRLVGCLFHYASRREISARLWAEVMSPAVQLTFRHRSISTPATSITVAARVAQASSWSGLPALANPRLIM